MEEKTEMAFQRYMEQKWKDDLDVVALRTCRIGTQCTRGQEVDCGAKKAIEARWQQRKPRQETAGGGRDALLPSHWGAPSYTLISHALLFGDLATEEREMVIEDNTMWLFC
jgi:hypothetical protein